MKKISLLVLLALVVSVEIVSSGVALGDTYNFHFTKPKKKTKKSVTVTPQGTAPAPEEVEKVEVEEEDEEAAEETPAKPERNDKKKTIKGSDDRAIIIHNHNYIGDAAKQAPAQSGPVPAPAPAPAEPSTTIKSEAAAPRANYHDARFRFGLAASYFPKKSIREHDWTNFSSSEQNYSAYGGTLSFGWIASNLLTLNLYGGGNHVEARDKTMYLLGFDTEFFPFANRTSTELSGLELGVVLGTITHFATDGNLLAVHAGGRLNVNLSGNMGLTAVARISESYLMFETGLITRF